MNIIERGLAFLAKHEVQLQRLAPVTAGMFAGAMVVVIMGWMMLSYPGSPESAQLEIVKWLGIFGMGFFAMALVSQLVSWGLVKSISKIKANLPSGAGIEFDTGTVVKETETTVETTVSVDSLD